MDTTGFGFQCVVALGTSVGLVVVDTRQLGCSGYSLFCIAAAFVSMVMGGVTIACYYNGKL